MIKFVVSWMSRILNKLDVILSFMMVLLRLVEDVNDNTLINMLFFAESEMNIDLFDNPGLFLLHLSLNRNGCWCTTDDSTASFLRFSVLLCPPGT